MDKQLTFEEKMQRLDEIVEAMQSSKVGLEESIRLFEEGSVLIDSLGAEISRAEEKVKILTMKNGESVQKDYTWGDEG